MRTVLLLLAALGGGVTHAEAPSASDRFHLFNRCGPMDVVVENLTTDASEINLTKNSLQAAAESRLRAARLYSADAPPYLYLNVHVVGGAYSIELSYKRRVCHSAISQCGYAKTWDRGSTGAHGRNAGFIRSNVSRHMDQFLVEYLRVNEESCSI